MGKLNRVEIVLINRIVKQFGDPENSDPGSIIKYIKTLTSYDTPKALELYYLYKNNYMEDGGYENIPGDEVMRSPTYDGINDTQIALAFHMEIDPVMLEDIGGHGRLDQYANEDGEEWVIGVYDDAYTDAYDLAKESYRDGYFGESFVVSHTEFNEHSIYEFASNEAENRVYGNMSDEDIRNESPDIFEDYDGDIDRIKDDIADATSELEDLEYELDNIDKDDESYDSISDQIERLKEKISDLENELFITEDLESDLMDRARDDLIEEYKDDILNEINRDPFGYFKYGLGYSVGDMISYGYADVDVDSLIEDAIDEDGMGYYLSPYDNQEYTYSYNDIVYYIYRVA